MNPEAKILFGWVLFGGTHIAGSTVAVRTMLISRLTLGGFKALYSVVALVTFVPLCWVYAENKHAGSLLFTPATGLGYATQALMLLAFVVMFQGLFTVSPLTTQAEMSGRFGAGARGIQRVTRHPQVLAMVLFAVAHLMVNPFAADWVFFGGFIVYGMLAVVHQDSRTRAAGSDSARGLLSETSAVPFAAIVSGRQRLAPSEYSLIGFIVSILLFFAVRYFHGFLFGASVG